MPALVFWQCVASSKMCEAGVNRVCHEFGSALAVEMYVPEVADRAHATSTVHLCAHPKDFADCGQYPFTGRACDPRNGRVDGPFLSLG